MVTTARMSACGTKRTSGNVRPMSAFEGKANAGAYRAKMGLWRRGFLHTRFPGIVLGKPSGSIGQFSWKRRVRTGTRG